MSRAKGQYAPDDGRMELYLAGWNDCQIAKKLVYNSTTIQNWRKRRGLPPNDKRGGYRHGKVATT